MFDKNILTEINNELTSFLERWIKEALSPTLNLGKEVKKLSEQFTKKRGKYIKDGIYMRDSKACEAYAALFLPKNIMKTCHVLTEINFPEKNINICDVGSGPGTASLGCIAFFGKRNMSLNIRLIDAYKENLQLATSALRSFRKTILNPQFKANITEQVHKLSSGNIGIKEKYDIIIFSNSLNEMDISGKDLVNIAQDCLKTNGVLIIIEPALKITSRKLISLREWFIQTKTLYPWAPCPHIMQCPALQSKSDWCHEEKSWVAPPIARRISSQVGIREDSIKYSFLILKKEAPETGQTAVSEEEREKLSIKTGENGHKYFVEARVISFSLKEKGRVCLHLCYEGKKLRGYLAKSKVTESNKAFIDATHGDNLLLSNVKMNEKEVIINRDSTVINREKTRFR